MAKPAKPPRVDVRKTYKLFVGGAFVRSESGRTEPVGDGGATVARGSRKDLRDAVVA
ncbi:MAG: aldehyde dehydrogenase family protein, partial [Vulcanimicrobiaceae bacterium]